jgi:hypothetical protein
MCGLSRDRISPERVIFLYRQAMNKAATREYDSKTWWKRAGFTSLHTTLDTHQLVALPAAVPTAAAAVEVAPTAAAEKFIILRNASPFVPGAENGGSGTTSSSDMQPPATGSADTDKQRSPSRHSFKTAWGSVSTLSPSQFTR